jgi:hypothetical protein
LLGAVVEAGDALGGEQEQQGVVEEGALAGGGLIGGVLAGPVEEAGDVVVVDEVDEDLVGGDAGGLRGRVVP